MIELLATRRPRRPLIDHLKAACRALDRAVAWKLAQEQRSAARFHRDRRRRRARARARRVVWSRLVGR